MKNYKTHPSSEFRHFLYDPEGDGMLFFRSAADRDKAASALILEYLDNGEWLDGVTDLCTGTLVHIVQQIGENPEEEGYDYVLKDVDK